MPKKTIDQRSLTYHILDIVLNIVIIVTIVGVIRTFIVSPFQVEGNSMIETLEHNEYIVINKFRYLFQLPERGDIVVFRAPTDPSKFYVKRVIGLPGDTLAVRSGNVYLRIDGEDKELPEAYLSPTSQNRTYRYPVSSGDTREEIFQVPDGEYFLLGDNRQGSLDSRSFGHIDSTHTAFVKRKAIKGSVWFIAFPVTKIQAFSAPDYVLK
ncbi:MAG: signal peptidase I [Candidatus Peribacteraceae bacterium]